MCNLAETIKLNGVSFGSSKRGQNENETAVIYSRYSVNDSVIEILYHLI